eukprot:scaffold243950_cov35-Tisochrysis_lutea.AAC.3
MNMLHVAHWTPESMALLENRRERKSGEIICTNGHVVRQRGRGYHAACTYEADYPADSEPLVQTGNVGATSKWP